MSNHGYEYATPASATSAAVPCDEHAGVAYLKGYSVYHALRSMRVASVGRGVTCDLRSKIAQLCDFITGRDENDKNLVTPRQIFTISLPSLVSNKRLPARPSPSRGPLWTHPHPPRTHAPDKCPCDTQYIISMTIPSHRSISPPNMLERKGNPLGVASPTFPHHAPMPPRCQSVNTLRDLTHILSTLTPQTRHFLLRPHHLPHLTLALSTPPKTHTHTIATQTPTAPLPDSTTQTLYHTLPASQLGFQIIVRAATHATFRTFRDDSRGIFLRVANFDDKLHVACTERLSGAVRRSYQAFLTTDLRDPTFVFSAVEIGTCPTCGKRGLCSCVCSTTGYDGVFEGIGRAVWHRDEHVVDVITRSHVIETADVTLATGLRQWALGECMTAAPVSLTRLALPCPRRIAIAPAAGSVQQVQQEMQARYEEETRRKIEERKMRNRRAAVQSNVKKKRMVEKMKKDLLDLHTRKLRLVEREATLRDENAVFRQLLLERDEGRDLLEDALVFE